MIKVSLAMALAVVLLAAGPAFAHEGHNHRIMGTVLAVDQNHIELTTKEEQKATFWLDGGTKILRGKSETTTSDVKVGERVVVTAVGKAGKMMALEVLLASASQ